MGNFADAVAAVRQLAEDRGVGDALGAGDAEAIKQVEPCVERFVYGELDPSEQLATARFARLGPAGAPPSLAKKLGRRLNSAEKAAAAGDAVRKALAWGWLACVAFQDDVMAQSGQLIEPRPERSPQDLWDFWAPSSHQMLETMDISPELARQLRGAGSDLFIDELKQLGLTRYLGGSKLNQLGMRYAQAGWLLRVVQTDDLDNEHFETMLGALRSDEDRPWRYEQYPV